MIDYNKKEKCQVCGEEASTVEAVRFHDTEQTWLCPKCIHKIYKLRNVKEDKADGLPAFAKRT